MSKRMIYLFAVVAVCVPAFEEASAVIVNDFQEWDQRIQLASIGGLEITATGHARFTARVDQDATDVIIHPGGVLETLDTYKLPDSHPEPELTNVYVYGTWNAHDIQSFGVDRAAYIYMGPEGVINLERGYDDSSASYNVLAWLDEAQLGGQSLLLAPELDPEVWSIQIEDLGGGACRITAYGPPPAAADDPHPENQATDAPIDAILSWTPGSFAVAHDVYLGTSFEDVNNATTADAAYRGRQTDTSYDPEELTFGQVYYWRIDEVNGAPDNTIFKGLVWSFTTESFAYPIETVSATASSATAGAGPENTVNRSGLDENDLHSTSSTTMWLSDPAGSQPTWIQYEFDRIYKLHEMWVWNYNVTFEPILGFGLRDVTVEYSEDGIDWLTLGDVQFAQGSAQEGYAYNTTVDLGGVAARQIRLTVNSGWGALPQYGLSEVRFMYIPVTAREPQPADGAVNVSVEMDLAWRAGREAASHEVYLGTDANALAL
ncbi:MAG: discoidin domain-containing protein, partial [Phycisphaerales bacterium]